MHRKSPFINLTLILVVVFFCIFASEISAEERVYYVHSDHLGSTTLISSESGSLVSQQNYYPYGTTRAISENPQKPTERQYTGQVSDQDQTGLYYYNARYYDPQIAKFTQADIVEGPNRYAYVANNPIKHIDPTGNADDAFGVGGGGSSTPIFVFVQQPPEELDKTVWEKVWNNCAEDLRDYSEMYSQLAVASWDYATYRRKMDLEVILHPASYTIDERMFALNDMANFGFLGTAVTIYESVDNNGTDLEEAFNEEPNKNIWDTIWGIAVKMDQDLSPEEKAANRQSWIDLFGMNETFEDVGELWEAIGGIPDLIEGDWNSIEDWWNSSCLSRGDCLPREVERRLQPVIDYVNDMID